MMYLVVLPPLFKVCIKYATLNRQASSAFNYGVSQVSYWTLLLPLCQSGSLIGHMMMMYILNTS